jgi:hypothetical protein
VAVKQHVVSIFLVEELAKQETSIKQVPRSIPPKRWFIFNGLHGVISHKTEYIYNLPHLHIWMIQKRPVNADVLIVSYVTRNGPPRVLKISYITLL